MKPLGSKLSPHHLPPRLNEEAAKKKTQKVQTGRRQIRTRTASILARPGGRSKNQCRCCFNVCHIFLIFPSLLSFLFSAFCFFLLSLKAAFGGLAECKEQYCITGSIHLSRPSFSHKGREKLDKSSPFFFGVCVCVCVEMPVLVKAAAGLPYTQRHCTSLVRCVIVSLESCYQSSASCKEFQLLVTDVLSSLSETCLLYFLSSSESSRCKTDCSVSK